MLRVLVTALLVGGGCASTPDGEAPGDPGDLPVDAQVCFNRSWDADTLNVDVWVEGGKRDVKAWGVDVYYAGVTYLDTSDHYNLFGDWAGFNGNSNGEIARAGGFTVGDPLVLETKRQYLYRVRFLNAPGEVSIRMGRAWDHIADMPLCNQMKTSTRSMGWPWPAWKKEFLR